MMTTTETDPIEHYASIFAERRVLACTLRDAQGLAITQSLTREAFFDPRHALVWDAITALSKRGEDVGHLTVTEELRRMDRLHTVTALTGPIYQLYGDEVGLTQLLAAVALLKELQGARALIRACQRATAIAQQQAAAGATATELRTDILREIGKATQQEQHAAVKPMRDILTEWWDQYDKADTGPRAARFGIASLDESIGDGQGLDRGALYVVAARPGGGKSALGCNALLATAEAGGHALYFSLEMSRRSLASRFLAGKSGVGARAILRKRLDTGEGDALAHATHTLDKLSMYIDDSPRLAMSEIRARATALNAQQPLSLVVIDHLHIVGEERGARGDNEVKHLSNVTGTAKQLAKELDCPVILLAQFNRGTEQRESDHRPRMRDLRGSGSIEQDADAVLLIYHASMYDDKAPKDVVEIHLAKQRDAATCVVEVGWDGELTRFYERAAASYQGETHIPTVPKRGRNLRVVNGDDGGSDE